MAEHHAALSALRTHPLANRLFAFGREHNLDIRLVGGAVRNALAGWAAQTNNTIDLDFAVNLPAETFMALAEDAGFLVIPTGLAHGTVTVLDGTDKAEVTQLRYDLDTDGRHAEIGFTDDWAEDANRRDFSINAIYLDGDGQLFDPAGGIADLAARRLCFIGDADRRLEEDYLRILRAVRFLSEYPELDMPSEDLVAIRRHTQKLVSLSSERKTSELVRIFSGAGVDRAVRLLHSLSIDRLIFGASISDTFLSDDTQPQTASPLSNSLIAGWFTQAGFASQLALLVSDLDRLAQTLPMHFSLSRKQQKALAANIGYLSDDASAAALPLDGDDWQKSCFRLANIASFVYLHGCIYGTYQFHDSRMRQIVHFVPPICPISGQDVIMKYGVNGREVGVILDRLTNEWVDSGFSLSKSELLS
ncbi:MAG: hypothetical protein ACPHTB_03030 [Candidatus Puniceispirillaceae bacterium]